MAHLHTLRDAAQAIASANAILVHTGAGMGVDSGLPDFRGPEGFWKAYPPLKHLGLRFEEMANPRHFGTEPNLAWGFYGHRLHLYRETRPHDGFGILREFAEDKELFAFTSNIDGHLQSSGFEEDRVYEVHGSLHWLQCVTPCCRDIWSATNERVVVDMARCLARDPLPHCARCGGLARPNVLMFGDWGFLSDRSERQADRFVEWMAERTIEELVVIEIGAGSAVPTVRRQSDRLARAGARLVRINPREAHGPSNTLSIPLGGLAALEGIRRELQKI